MFLSKDPKKFLIRTAYEVKRYRILMRVIPIVLSAVTLFTSTIYVIAVMYDKYGSYTVSINKLDNIDYQLALSEERNFNTMTSRLNARAGEKITNISVNDLPNDLDMIDGSHNGANYVAYTYYMKNVGKRTVKTEYLLYIVNVTQNLDKAVRIRLYINGEPSTYARTKSDGTGAEDGCEEFISATTISRRQLPTTAPGDVVKFTVVIWIEGDDIDCTDDLIGGTFKIDMKISIVAVDEDGDGIIDSDYSSTEESKSAEAESDDNSD